MSSVLAKRG